MVMGDRIKPAAQQAMRQATQRTGTVTSNVKPHAAEKPDHAAALPTQHIGHNADDAVKGDVDD